MSTNQGEGADSDQGAEAAQPVRPYKPFDCVAIVGVGLMGGSLGMAIRKRLLAEKVIGIDLRQEVLETAVAAGAVDAGSDSLRAAAPADCVVFAAPVSLICSLIEKGAAFLRPDALITDFGSVKRRIVETGERLFGNRFVGGHPMAGSEESGIAAARPDLFEGAAWAVVRSASFALDRDAPAARIAAMISALGGRPVALTANDHDHLAALVSHLPHLLSFAFARTVNADTYAEQARQMAGGSYRDLIRVSYSDPTMWRDIFLGNREALQAAIELYESHLDILKSALEEQDPAALLQCLQS